MSKKSRRRGKGNQRIPGWAKRERMSDLAWIMENQHIFWPAAQQQYQEHGRGAIVVDTTVRPTGAGHPFAYYPQVQVNELGDQDSQRMVREYNPQGEMVIVLLKPKGRASTYRIQLVRR